MAIKRQLTVRQILAAAFAASLLPFLIVRVLHPWLYLVVGATNYLVFHNIAEFFSVMVSMSIFGVGWFTYRQSRDRHALFLGSAFLAVGIMDFMHALSYAGMPSFFTANSPNKATLFWLAARLFASASFLASAFVYPGKPYRWLSKPALMAGVIAVSGIVFICVIFFSLHMPGAFVTGIGLAPFKKALEWLVICMLFMAFIAYWKRMSKPGDRHLVYYMSAFIICIFGELAFTSYRSVFDTYSVLGHLYKAAAFFLIYKGTFASSVNDPYLKLSDANEKLCVENAERLGAEEKLLRINRIYAVLSRTNHAIVHAADQDSLFREICNDAVEHGAFRMVWIGLVDEDTKMVRSVAWSGVNDGFLDAVRISVRDEPEGWGPTGSAIREGSLRITSDILGDCRSAPWHEEARKRGYLSSAAISLKLNGKPIGALTMYAGEKNFFRWQLAELLQQMGMDISFALDNFDRETRRREAERALRDETLERLRAMEALREKEQLLMHQSRLAAMGEMINNIAHQWRQPLNTLALYAQVLRETYRDGECSAEFVNDTVNQIMKLVFHMSQTIDDFRNFFRPDLEMRPFNLEETVGKALSLVTDSLRSHNIQVNTEAREELIVTGYPNEFSQVLLNILNNARDALMERKVDSPEIRIRLFREDEKSVVTISDNAGGIAASIIDKIFEPYFTTKDEVHGTGIGLYISRTIIEKRMNGRISAINTDQGAEFRIDM